MLDCAWNPTRHPARSSPTTVVSTMSGGSAEAINVPKASSLTSVARPSFVAQEEGLVLSHGPQQVELGQSGARRRHRDRQRVTTHERRDRETQLVEAVRGDELTE